MLSSGAARDRAPPLDGAQNAELKALLARLRALEGRLGRRVRVLHIGNIANNAFHNAKLQRAIGIEADVLCYDYYHMMGCPEWEDAEFDGEIGDDFRPCWHALDMHGYRRPAWFAQGPFGLACDYLVALREGRSAAASRRWNQLAVANGTADPGSRSLWEAFSIRARVLWDRLRWLASRPGRVAERLRDERRRRALESRGRPRRIRERLKSFGRGMPLTLLMALRVDVVYRAAWTTWSILRRPSLMRAEANRLAAVRRREGRSALFFVAVSGLGEVVGRVHRALHKILSRAEIGDSDIDFASERAMRLCEEFGERFGNRRGRLLLEDTFAYTAFAGRWNSLFRHYDVVQGYATDPIWPMLAGREYFAFEHGTLREIPFEETSRGRLTALAFAKARHVFVTNSDCVDNARTLCGERFTFINHPYDEDDALVSGWEPLRAEFMERLTSEHLLLHPTRHDWVEGTGYADKANDVFLRAFIALRERGHAVGLILCDWGKNTAESRALIVDAGLEGHVHWEPPMSGLRLLKVARASDVVCDQFKLGAFGGVSFKAMAAACPVCTKLDEGQARTMFGEAPPVVNCSTTEALVERLGALLADPARLAEIGQACRRWIERCHSGRQVTEAHLRAYLPALEEAHPHPPGAERVPRRGAARTVEP